MRVGVSGPRPPVTLWGRGTEAAVVDRVVGGVGAAMSGVVIVGDPGIGKSSLWARGVAAAARKGAKVLALTCVQAESEMPYAGLEVLLSDVLGEFGGRLPAPQRAALDSALIEVRPEGATNPRTVAAGVVTLLASALDAGPVVIALDDLHWIDPETHTSLTYAARRLADRPLRWMLASREESPLWRSPRDLGDDGLVRALQTAGDEASTILRLGPLSSDAIGALVHERLGIRLSSAEHERLATRTGGNPFWALELGQAWGTALDTPSSPLLSRLVTDRVTPLDADVVDAASLIAALGRPRPSTVISAISADGAGDAPTAKAESILDRATTAGLVCLADGRLAPVHPLIGAGLLAWLPPLRRQRLYRRAATLADSPEARALYLLEATGGGSGDEGGSSTPTGARAELLAALDEASAVARRRGAASTAARFAARALSLADEHTGTCSAADRARRRVATSELYVQAGELAAALSTLEAVELADLDADLLDRAAPLLAQTRNEQQGGAAARLVADQVEAAPLRDGADGATRRRALVATLRADLQCGAVGDRRAIGREAVEASYRSSSRTPLRRRALGALAHALFDADEPVDDVLDRLDALDPPEALDPGGGSDVALLHAMSLHYSGHDIASRKAFEAAFEHHIERGDELAIAGAGDMLAYIELYAGSPAAAEATLDRIDKHVDWRRSAELPWIMNTRGDLHLVRGEHDALEELLNQLTAAGHRSARSIGFISRLRGILAMQRGQPDAAVTYFTRFSQNADDHGFRNPYRRLDVDDHLVSALVATGDHTRAQQVVDGYATYDKGAGRIFVRGQRPRALALLAAHRDHELDRAVSLARESTAHLEGAPFPSQYGRSLATLADLHDLQGEHGMAAEVRRRAYDLFVRIDQRWWARHVSIQGFGLGDLSRSERSVAELVAGGASNRDVAAALVLSVRTVENHLRSVYRKLGVRSRNELGASTVFVAHAVAGRSAVYP